MNIELEKECKKLGISIEEAIQEKIHELQLRNFIRCIPNEKTKLNKANEFYFKVTGEWPSDSQFPFYTEKRSLRLNEDQKILLEERQSYRCKVCGSHTARIKKLHVDHIKPICFGGKDEFSNLQLLCSDCNLGKGSSLHWIMNNPFFCVDNKVLSMRLRYSVLQSKNNKCCFPGCTNDSSNSHLKVTPIVSPSFGGSFIFDNLTTYCTEHFTQKLKLDKQNSSTKLFNRKQGSKIFKK